MKTIPPAVWQLFKERERLRKIGKFGQADVIRRTLITQGYTIRDNPDDTSEIYEIKDAETIASKPGEIIVFGSGELASTGRKIHELAIKHIAPPVNIALLETPAGYEDNPHQWYTKLKKMMGVGLKNYSPEITLIPALRRDGNTSTNNPEVLAPLLTADYIHTGAGSPTYAVKHLKNSLALEYITKRLNVGVSFSIASAAAIAFGKYTLPVYEIYFAGHDLSWMDGLDFFSLWGLNITFIPHWNNKEGGEEVDTRYSYMGQRRFNKLLKLLPGPTTIVGIDEHTALLFETEQRLIKVLGKGSVTISKGNKNEIFASGQKLSFTNLEQ